MLRVEARNAEAPIERKPEWIRTTRARWARSTPSSQRLVRARACTRCARRRAAPTSSSAGRTARRPSSSAATQCTRRCDFCQIDTGKPEPLDRDEPRRVAESVRHDGPALRHGHRRRPRRPARRGRVAVRRDGPRDPRAQPRHRRRDPRPGLLRQARAARAGLRRPPRGVRAQPRDGAPDLQADPPGVPLRALAGRAHAGPRRRAGHQVQPHPRHGRDPEVAEALRRPARRGLRPHHDHPVPAPLPAHHPVERWVRPRSSSHWREAAEELGFLGVMSGPLVRSSYRAGRLWAQAMARGGRSAPEPWRTSPGDGRSGPPGGGVAARPRRRRTVS